MCHDDIPGLISHFMAQTHVLQWHPWVVHCRSRRQVFGLTNACLLSFLVMLSALVFVITDWAVYCGSSQLPCASHELVFWTDVAR